MTRQWNGRKKGEQANLTFLLSGSAMLVKFKSTFFSAVCVLFLLDLRYDECRTKLTPFLKKVGFNPRTGGCSGSQDIMSFYEIVHVLIA